VIEPHTSRLQVTQPNRVQVTETNKTQQIPTDTSQERSTSKTSGKRIRQRRRQEEITQRLQQNPEAKRESSIPAHQPRSPTHPNRGRRNQVCQEQQPTPHNRAGRSIGRSSQSREQQARTEQGKAGRTGSDARATNSHHVTPALQQHSSNTGFVSPQMQHLDRERVIQSKAIGSATEQVREGCNVGRESKRRNGMETWRIHSTTQYIQYTSSIPVLSHVLVPEGCGSLLAEFEERH
jgi:hypothetical protein